ncbi:hypothetical protein Nepgr_030465 [Nepenthes gracilis]|uniref:Protein TRIGALACTOSYLDIACYLGLYCEROL 4, chloroplastic n=1 Tax=Nepenthes gracilis TaxID=150966 RepID=A0AAD3TH12_NEPGR|nr:hypothetical protein Nepgr_030465 [Nepenthes gracilis]
MKKLRWVMDGEFWDVDMSTPITLDAPARPATGHPLPLGLSRGTILSRPRQIDFMQRFMSVPFVPSYAGDPAHGGRGFSLQRVLTLPLANDWSTTLQCQLNLQKFMSSIKDRLVYPSELSWLQSFGRCLRDKSFYAIGLCSEFVVTPDDTVLVGHEVFGDTEISRKKALFHHKFSNHKLTMEAVWPGLFVDKHGTFWDVPFSMAIDLASVASNSGPSYHLCMQHISGSAKQTEGSQTRGVPASLFPGLCLKSAFSFKKNIDIWRSCARKLKLVQPFDILLSNPHVSASGIIGVVGNASVGDNYVISRVEDEPKRSYRCFNLGAYGRSCCFLADSFASFLFTAQHGNFQKLVLDLTRFHVRLDFPSGSKFISAAAHLAQDVYNSRQLTPETVEAICPHAAFSLQQQIVGPFSFRVDSGVAVNLKNREWQVKLEDPVFAIEYALQVLVSAKAIAWYAPKRQEFMVELRFFET